MTVMDKICGFLTRKRKMGGFKICGMHVDLHPMCADRVRKPAPEMQEYLKRKMLSIMLCVNWVCEGAFDDHECVSENTNAMQIEELMGKGLDYELCIPCVVQCLMLRFSALTRLNQTMEDGEMKSNSAAKWWTWRLRTRSHCPLDAC